MSEPPVISGWIRKRPRFGAGAWAQRFFVLSSTDATIRAFADESELALTSSKLAKQRSLRKHIQREDSDDEPQPSFSLALPKDVLVTEPYEKFVRFSKGPSKKEKLWVIKVYLNIKDEKIQNLCALGAPTREEAAKWKICIESTAKKVSLSPSSPKNASLEEESKHRLKQKAKSFWGTADDEKWEIVHNEDGVQIEGEKQFTKEFPSLRARATIRAKPKEVFDLIMDDSKRTTWDENVVLNQVLREISETSHIVYVQMKPIWIGPIYTGPRDLVLLRYWRMDSDGTYVVTWQSVEDPELSPTREGFTRGKIFAMGFTIAPASPKDYDQSIVRLFCHADPGPPFSLLPSAVLQKWMYPFVTRLVGVKKALEKSKNVEQAPGISGDIFENEETPVIPPPGSPASISQAAAEEKNTLKIGSMDHSTWIETPQQEPYTIRSKTYLEDAVKYKCGKKMFHLVAVDLYKLNGPTPHCASRSDSPLNKIREVYPERPIFVLQFMLPGPPYFSLSIYAVAKKGVLDDPDAPFARLWTDFIEGSDEYRASVFKMIPRVTSGAYVVRKTVGETPAILARKMKMNFYVAKDYIECDCDLGSSAVAGSILSIVKGYATTLTVDLGILLEGHSVDELPEVMLCSLRMVKPIMGQALRLGPDPNPEQTRRNLEAFKKITVVREDSDLEDDQ